MPWAENEIVQLNRIDSSNQAAATTGIPARPQGQAPAQAPQVEPDKAAFQSSEALDRAWQGTPEVRSEKVAQAKALIQDSSYPSDEVVSRIAALIAERLNAGGPEG
jgi:hypothetical protein